MGLTERCAVALEFPRETSVRLLLRPVMMCADSIARRPTQAGMASALASQGAVLAARVSPMVGPAFEPEAPVVCRTCLAWRRLPRGLLLLRG